MTALDRAIAAAAARRAATGNPTDLERITAIERIPYPADEYAAAAAVHYTQRLRRHPDARPLRPVQGLGLLACERAAAAGHLGAMVGALGVGHGKFLLSVLAPEVMLAERPMLFIPAALREQTRDELRTWGQEYAFRVPRVVAYSELSMASASSVLDYHAPDLIVADEAHMLRHATAARTKRVFRYLREHPTTRLVLLSGTLSSSSLLDMAHLLEAALREGTPLPLHRKTLEQWSSVIDPDGVPDADAHLAIAPLVAWSGVPRTTDRQEDARRAFEVRFSTTPGVVTTREPSVGANLWLVPRCPEVPKGITEALAELEATWTIGEDELVDAMAMARVAGQLSMGFYYRWDWQPGAREAWGDEWLARRGAYHRAVRVLLQHHSRRGLDSPMLVGKWLAEGHGGPDIRAAWSEWTLEGPDVGHDGAMWCDIDPPPVATVWLTQAIMDDAAAWAHDNGPALLWYQSKAVAEALAARGIAVYGAGSSRPDHDRTPVAAVSIGVHGRGQNLQAWHRQLVLEPPSSGSTWTQMLGRTWRMGQRADDVVAVVYQHTARLRMALDAARDRSEYIEQSLGQQQALLVARTIAQDPTRAP